MVKPSLRREKAQRAVATARCSIRQASVIFSVSESCYRYRARLGSENAEIAGLLLRLTHNQRNWGFGLCFLYLRNVKGYRWNHKRVYRRTGTESAYQAPQAVDTGEARATGGAHGHQNQLVHGLHA